MNPNRDIQYLKKLKARLDMIYDIASDHLMDFGADEIAPDVDTLIEMALEQIQVMEADLDDPAAAGIRAAIEESRGDK